MQQLHTLWTGPGPVPVDQRRDGRIGKILGFSQANSYRHLTKSPKSEL